MMRRRGQQPDHRLTVTQSKTGSAAVFALVLGLIAFAPIAPATAQLAQDHADQAVTMPSLTMSNCLITPSRTVHLSAGRPGLLGSVAVDRGDIITAGQPLASLDNKLEKAELEIAQMRVDTSTKVDLAAARRDYERKRAKRAEGLAKDDHISESDYQEAAVAYDLARLELAAAKEDQARAALELDRANAMHAMTELIAPFDAVVIDRHYSPGEFVDRQPVLTLAALDPLFVELVTDAADYGKITEGEVATVFHELSAPEGLPAKVAIIDKSIDAASGTFRIRLILPNPDHKLPSGVKCTVKFGTD